MRIVSEDSAFLISVLPSRFASQPVYLLIIFNFPLSSELFLQPGGSVIWLFSLIGNNSLVNAGHQSRTWTHRSGCAIKSHSDDVVDPPGMDTVA